MEKREFEKLGVETSLLGFGCMRFPMTEEGKIDEQEAEKMICDEFSYVLGIPKEDVPSYITNSMKESIH